MTAKRLMFQGTGSDVGKSVLVAGLCRAFRRRGLAVLPFKPQNMSNNAAVADDGGEIGRAQWLQALACGVPPSVHMNPVLLKPQSNTGAQVILRGRVHGVREAGEFQKHKAALLPAVLESFDILRDRADLVLVEGAGSAAETNLRAQDIANMGFAIASDTPVVLIGDIDRGGVIAQLVGTHAVLAAADRALIGGYIINRFRGDMALFAEGLKTITAHTGWPDLGMVPHLDCVRALPAEDGVVLQRASGDAGDGLTVAVPMLPRIANFDDLDPLRAEPGISVVFVPPGRPIPAAARLIVIPGSKATLADLRALRAEGWDVDILAHARRGGAVLGLCGGYQMLGRAVHDPDGLEGSPGSEAGLGLLDLETTIKPEKTVGNVTARWARHDCPVAGYEIHCGVTDGPALARPFITDGDRVLGAATTDGRVAGCYLHGLFTDDRFRRAYLEGIGMEGAGQVDARAVVDGALDDLAAALETHLDLDALLALAR